MTTIDRAAQIIADAFRPLMKGHSDSLGRDLARALSDAGLLAPDLPEPETKPAVRAARQALEAPIPLTNDQAEELTIDWWYLPLSRTEAGYPNCATCDGGGCPDCTDPA